jgi:alkylhydroperoxidase family enzyme
MSEPAQHQPAQRRPVRIRPLPEPVRSARQQEVINDFVRGPTANIYATVARHPDVAEAAFNLGRTLRGRGLPERHREILILRTGCNCGSAYELAQHYRVASGMGMSKLDMERIRLGPEAEGWDPFEVVLCRAADELHVEHTLTDQTWAALAERYDEQELIQATALVGYYHLVCFLLNTLGVPIEDGVPHFPVS